MKFTSTCYGADVFREWCETLVRKNVATVKKESCTRNGHTDLNTNRFYTMVYDINIMPQSMTEMIFDRDNAIIRFVYDRRYNQITAQYNDRAEIKISQDSLRKLLGSIYISSLIKKLNVQVKNTESIRQILEQAIRKTGHESETVEFSAKE